MGSGNSQPLPQQPESEINTNPRQKARKPQASSGQPSQPRFQREILLQIDDRLPQDALELFQKAFDVFDTNKDGKITMSDFSSALMETNGEVNEQLKCWINELGDDKDGAIDFDEFISILAKRKTDKISTEDKKSAFKVFDRDGNRLISVTQLKHVMMNLGEKFTEDEVGQMLRQANLDGNATLDEAEFFRLMMFG